MKQAQHLAFLKDQGAARSHRRCRPDQQGLAHQAAFAQKIAAAEKGDDCLFASDGGHSKLDAAVLNVVKAPGCLPLREECLSLVEFDPFPRTDGIQKSTYVKNGFGVRL